MSRRRRRSPQPLQGSCSSCLDRSTAISGTSVLTDNGLFLRSMCPPQGRTDSAADLTDGGTVGSWLTQSRHDRASTRVDGSKSISDADRSETELLTSDDEDRLQLLRLAHRLSGECQESYALAALFVRETAHTPEHQFADQ